MSEPTLALVLRAAGEVFGHPADASDNFFGLGGDSAAAVELAVLIEDGYGAEVDPELIMTASSLDALAKRLDRVVPA